MRAKDTSIDRTRSGRTSRTSRFLTGAVAPALVAVTAACAHSGAPDIVEPSAAVRAVVEQDPAHTESTATAEGGEDMPTELEAILNEALDDEYKARATYRAVLDAFGPVRPFVNIIEAESRHADALLALYARYGLDAPPDRWAGNVEAPPSLARACELAVEGERENAAMYERLLAATQAPDVRRVLENLQRASQENHLPAFERCLARESGSGGGGRGRRGGGRRQRWRGGRGGSSQ